MITIGVRELAAPAEGSLLANLDEMGDPTNGAPLSLHAIHLAAAGRLGRDLEGIATYDGRMAAAAAELGHAVAAPAP